MPSSPEMEKLSLEEVVVKEETTRTLSSAALSPFCSRLIGSFFLIFAAAIHAIGNATLKQLSGEGVDVFAALFLRGVVSIILNLLVARMLYGVKFARNVINGFPLASTKNIEQLNVDNGFTLPSANNGVNTTYLSKIKLSVGIGYGIYLRGFAGSITAAVILYTITNVMNFADTFALFLGLGTITTNIIAICYLKEKLRMDIVIGACLCIIGVIFVSKPNFIFNTQNEHEQRYRTMSVYGFTLVVIAACFLAVFNVLARKLNNRSPQAILHGYMVMTALLNGGILISNPGLYAYFPTNLNQWFTIFLYIGIQITGQLMVAKGNQYAEAGIASVVNNSELFFTFIVDVIMLGDVLNILSVFGGCIIFFGAVTTILGEKVFSGLKKHYYVKNEVVDAKKKEKKTSFEKCGRRSERGSGGSSFKNKKKKKIITDNKKIGRPKKVYNELVVMGDEDDKC